MPEEETCPEGLEAKPAREPFGWPFWLLLASSTVILACFAVISNHRPYDRANRTEAISNLRQIGFALLEFDAEYGSFPGEATAALVTKKFPEHGYALNGRSSNAFFRQLFAAELTQSEAMFYAKVPGARKPDGEIRTGKLLEKGEVGFAYVAKLSSAGNPARPIAFAPVISGTKKFDPAPFKGNAVFLRVDNSAISIPIEKDGRVLLDGIDILSAENPIWDGKAPDIRYPE